MSASALSIDPSFLHESLCGNPGPRGHPVAGELPSTLVTRVALDSSKRDHYLSIRHCPPPKVKQPRALGPSLPNAPRGSNWREKADFSNSQQYFNRKPRALKSLIPGQPRERGLAGHFRMATCSPGCHMHTQMQGNGQHPCLSQAPQYTCSEVTRRHICEGPRYLHA